MDRGWNLEVKNLRAAFAVLALAWAFFAQAAVPVEVTVAGVDDDLKANVMQWLSIQQQRNHPLMTEGRVRRLFLKAEQEIERALRPYGYYRPQTEPSLSQAEDGSWHAHYQIDAGPPLLIAEVRRSLSGEAQHDERFIAMWQAFPLMSGMALDQILYEAAKADLLKLAHERGYFDAHFGERRITVDLEHYQADIDLSFNSGPRYRFGEIALQQRVLDADLFERYINFAVGDPYDVSLLLSLQQALIDSDYFREVEVLHHEGFVDQAVPISVRATPRKDNRYTLALGYGTDTGARGKLGWERPRVNARGHRIESEIHVSEIGSGIEGRYHVPVGNPRKERLTYSAGYVTTRLDTSESDIGTLGVSLLQIRGAWQETLALNYHNEEFVIADEYGETTLLIPSIGLGRRWAQERLLIDEGVALDMELRGASESLWSDTDFVQARTKLKGLTTLAQRHRFIGRIAVGSTEVDSFAKLPASVRFFAGGAQSVRGYRYQSLGPLNHNGEVVGGKHLVESSVEYEYRFAKDWGLALFADAGNAMNDFSADLKHGAGVGLRWQTPVGALRFDAASATSEPGQPWRIHINIGPDL